MKENIDYKAEMVVQCKNSTLSVFLFSWVVFLKSKKEKIPEKSDYGKCSGGFNVV